MKFRIDYIENDEYKTAEAIREDLPKYKHLGKDADEIEKMAAFLLEKGTQGSIANPRTGLVVAVI